MDLTSLLKTYLEDLLALGDRDNFHENRRNVALILSRDLLLLDEEERIIKLTSTTNNNNFSMCLSIS